jgi:branched-subunit amino acid transport protein AzlD
MSTNDTIDSQNKPENVGMERSEPSRQSLESGTKFSQRLIDIGFLFSLFLSAACLILSAYYLYLFLNNTNTGIEQLISKVGKDLSPEVMQVAINARLVIARILLLSCGISAGLSFGFLGFALFLLGIKKEIDVDAKYENSSVKFARMSPGVLIILISSILIGICATRSTPFWYENKVTEEPGDSNANQNLHDNSNAENNSSGENNSNNNSNVNGNQKPKTNPPPRTKDMNP